MLQAVDDVISMRGSWCRVDSTQLVSGKQLVVYALFIPIRGLLAGKKKNYTIMPVWQAEL